MGCHIPKIWQIVTYLSYTPLISEEWVCTYLVGVQNIRNLATMHSTQRHTKTQRFPAMEKALWSSICTQQGPDYTDTYTTKAYSIGVYVRREDPSSRTYIPAVVKSIAAESKSRHMSHSPPVDYTSVHGNQTTCCSLKLLQLDIVYTTILLYCILNSSYLCFFCNC